MDIRQKVKEVKQSFRLMMDGATAQSMREKGLQYRVNWGATLPRLHELADQLKAEADGQCYDLALALWKEDVRECKILSTMIMPPEEMLPEVADIWKEQTTNIEIAEQAAFNLYQYLPYAAEKAFQWLSSAYDIPQICGYHILSRLFMQGNEPNERGINEFLDQALCALQSPNLSLRKAAMQSVLHFAELGLVYQRMAHSATTKVGLDIF